MSSMSASHQSGGSSLLQSALVGGGPISLPTLPIRFRRPQLLECLDGCLICVASDEDLGGRPVTLKAIPKELLREDQEALSREVMNLHTISRYSHPGIITLLDVLLTPDHLLLVLDWFVPSMSLARLLQQGEAQQRPPLNMYQVHDVFRQLVSALELCHAVGVVHRDVRPEMVHVGPGGRCKLWGFTASKCQNMLTQPKTRRGSVLFAPPEFMTGSEGEAYDGRRVDVWDAGVTLWMMAFGGHPFISREVAARGNMHAALAVIMENVVSGALQLPAGAEQAQPQLVDLLQKMLCPVPAQRLTASEVLQHPWMTSPLGATPLPPQAQEALALTASLLARGPLPNVPYLSITQVEELLELALADNHAPAYSGNSHDMQSGGGGSTSSSRGGSRARGASRSSARPAAPATSVGEAMSVT